MCHNAHCRVRFMCADLRLRFRRLIKVNVGGWVVVGGCRGQTLRLALAQEVAVRAEQSLSIRNKKNTKCIRSTTKFNKVIGAIILQKPCQAFLKSSAYQLREIVKKINPRG